MPMEIPDYILKSIVSDAVKHVSDLKVGEGVVVKDPHSAYNTVKLSNVIRTVVKITKTQMTDSEGDRWVLRGGDRLGSTGYQRAYVKPLTRAEAEQALCTFHVQHALALMASKAVKDVVTNPDAAEELVNLLKSWYTKHKPKA